MSTQYNEDRKSFFLKILLNGVFPQVKLESQCLAFLLRKNSEDHVAWHYYFVDKKTGNQGFPECSCSL